MLQLAQTQNGNIINVLVSVGKLKNKRKEEKRRKEKRKEKKRKKEIGQADSL